MKFRQTFISRSLGDSKRITVFIVAVLIFFLTFILRLRSLYTPFDNEYETLLALLGRQVFKGGGFYSTVPWSMKPPGESLTYGLLYLMAGAEKWELAVRVFLIVLNCLAAVTLLYLGKIAFSFSVGVLAAFFWTVFSSDGVIRGTVGYAEGFMPFFTILAYYLFLVSHNKKNKILWVSLSGLSLGIALLYKQSAAFDFLPLLIYILVIKLWPFSLSRLKKLKSVIVTYFPLGLGFILPLLIFIVFIYMNGKFGAFWEWVFLKPAIYGKIRGNTVSFLSYIWKNTSALWVLALLGIIWTATKFKKERLIFIFWLLGGTATMIMSGKYWGYCFMQLLAPISILAALAVFDSIRFGEMKITKSLFCFKAATILALVLFFFIRLLNPYYQISFSNLSKYFQGKISYKDYRLILSNGKIYRERLEAAEFLKTILKKEDRVYIWDGDTGIYVFADIMPLYKNFIFSQQFWFSSEGSISFTYFSSSQTIEGNRSELINNLTSRPPNYIVLGIDSPVIAFSLLKEFNQFFSFVFQNYSLIKNIEDIWVYQLKQKPMVIPEDRVVDFDFVKRYFLVEPVSDRRVVIRPIAGEFSELEASIAEGNVIKESNKIPVQVLFFGLDGKDLVGAATYGPSGETDLHLRLKKEKTDKIKTISIIRKNTLWVYPPNGANLVIEAIEGENKIDLYFSRSDSLTELNKGEYELSIFYIDGSTSKLKIPAKDIKIVTN